MMKWLMNFILQNHLLILPSPRMKTWCKLYCALFHVQTYCSLKNCSACANFRPSALDSLLENHRTVVVSEEKYHRITVRRRHLLQDSMTAFRIGFPFNSHLAVTFLGEPAVDAGGPCREFFRLLLQEIFQSSLFEGLEGSRVPAHNMTALDKRTYWYIGKFEQLVLRQAIIYVVVFRPDGCCFNSTRRSGTTVLVTGSCRLSFLWDVESKCNKWGCARWINQE